jgi:quercetin dioxygenase-like cupin family protein
VKIVNLQDVDAEAVETEGASRVTIREAITDKDGAPNYSMRYFVVEAGGQTPFHTHPWEHEVFIAEGSGTLELDSGERDLAQGDFVFVEPNRRHAFRASRGQPLEFICVIPHKTSLLKPE